MDEKRCGNCKQYCKKKRACKITKKPVMKITPSCIKFDKK